MKNVKRLLPSYPVFVKDPYFSLWSPSEHLNGCNLEGWWGEEKHVYGFLRTGGKTYCFLGDAKDLAPHGVLPAEETSLGVTAFTTDYAFVAGGAKLSLRFVSPLPPDDLDLLSMPVCWMEYKIEGAPDAEIALFVSRDLACNASQAHKTVRGDFLRCDGYETAFLGLSRQMPLSEDGDRVGADWGYWFVAGERARLFDGKEFYEWLAGSGGEPRAAGEDRWIGASSRAKSGALLLGFDDTISINYFGRYLRGYYLEYRTIYDALADAWKNRGSYDAQLAAFDAALSERAAPFGEGYGEILRASLRQSVGAHKLVRDGDRVLFLSKECGSNGCIATVDVTYPSMPLYLEYAPELVKGMLRPVLDFARMPVWNCDFAPHDAGTYPTCSGQVYALRDGMGEDTLFLPDVGTRYLVWQLPAGCDIYDFSRQMPVEESANLLIAFFACYRCDGDIGFFRAHADLAKKWVHYLVDYGLRPENQLCTDDFAGRLKNNINLAVKAAVGIAAYAELADALGDADTKKKFRAIAESFAAEIVAFAEKFPRLPLTWDSDETTFSLKYNFAFDKACGLGLFPQSLFERETADWIACAGRFGIPLDSRSAYVKSDWILWAATLTDDPAKREAIIAPVAKFLRESPDRVPFSDWYDADTGKSHHFRARTVQGGCFFPLLAAGGKLQKKH